MAKKNFLLLSMEDTKIKKVSNVISNDSCRKILDYLSERESTTETDLAESLGLPISTVHYNMQQLLETGLISADEFHYSKKGKEVSHYRVANKYIIIAPKSTYGIKERLKSILPAVLIAGAAAGAIRLFSGYVPRQEMMTPEADTARSIMEAKVMSAAPAAGSAAGQTATSLPQEAALWFLGGALFALAVYFVIGVIKREGIGR